MVKVAFQDFTVSLAPRRDHPTPLFRQLYLGLRDEIIGGRLEPGTRLPPTRALAQRLAVARNTVINAYEQLAAEGYVEGRIGSGTRVATELPVDAGPAPEPRARHAQWPEGIRSALPRRGPRGVFRTDEPAFDAFPFETMRRLITNRMRDNFAGLLGNDDPQGLERLRRAIAHYVTAERGIPCGASQIVITAGSLHGLDLVARALRISGQVACVEDPGDIAVRANLEASGARLVAVPVDAEGCMVERLVKGGPRARLVVITPSNQYPIGGTMTLARRLALLEWAAEHDVTIFEDDADSEFRYATRPLSPLKALDRRNAVAYAATFSRILHPNLRLGYLILPPRLVPAVVDVRLFSDRHPPPLEQAMVAEFIARGHFAIHVRRMRKLYKDRQTAVVNALRRRLPKTVAVQAAGAGINSLVLLPSGIDDRALAETARREGFDVLPLTPFYVSRRARPGLLLGSASGSNTVEVHVRKLSDLIAAEIARASSPARSHPATFP